MSIKNDILNVTDMKQKIYFVKTIASNRVHKHGGDEMAQTQAKIHAELLIRGGRSAATAIENGYQSGMRVFNNPLLRQQAI